MRINTTQFGPQEVDPRTILFFPHGLPGFEHLTKFKLFHEDKEDPLMHWLQALGDPDVAFAMVDPGLLGVRYEIPLSDEEVTLLKSADPSHLMVFTMLIAEGEDSDRHVGANLTRPVIVNPDARRGLQLSASLSDYEVIPTPEPVSA